jgi:hypothetical protein
VKWAALADSRTEREEDRQKGKKNCGLRGPRIESLLGGGGEIFRTRPDRPWGPPSLLYNGYRVFPGGKAAGLKKEYSSPLGLHGLIQSELYLLPLREHSLY